MQHMVSGRVHGSLGHSWGLVHKTLLVLAAGFAALVLTWIGYMAMVTAYVLWG
jgi:hypothetical protein